MLEVKSGMKKVLALFTIALLAVVISGCGQNSEVIATYQGGEVTDVEFEHYLGAMLFLSQEPALLRDDPEFRLEALHQYIAMHLLSAEADEDTWKIQKKVANEEFTLMKQQFLQSSTKKDWDALVKQLGTEDNDIKSFLEYSNVVGELLDKSVDDADIAEQYERLKEAKVFDKMVISHILVATENIESENIEPLRTMDEALEIVEEIMAKLAQGEDFDVLAAAYSDDTSTAQEGGVLPEMSGSQLSSVFGPALLALPIGEISEPIEMDYGYHIVRVDSLKVEQLDEIDDGTKRQLRSFVVSTKFMDYVETELPAKIVEINL